MPSVVEFSSRRPAASCPAPGLLRDDLSRLVDGLQILALTRPAALLAVKEIVFGLLDSNSSA